MRDVSPHSPTLSETSPDTPRARKTQKWSLGIMADYETDEVPGSVLLLSGLANHNAPLGITKRLRSGSTGSRHSERSEAMFGRYTSPIAEKKRTTDGKIILEPQPDSSLNDPLNWSAIRRDAALVSLGFYCMLGGGMTPILAAGFSNVATTYHVTIPQVALTTGLYMLGLGVGSVIWSPTAIALGKRPVYLFASVFFVLTAVWCALSPNYPSLVVARVFMGLAVSPVECLPSATIAEIFFLHERAYRLGVYTLLLLGGKNLVPLVSAAIIQGLSWEWVFWIVAIIVGFCSILLFFFVPETFWDRTPVPHHKKPPHRRPTLTNLRTLSSRGQRIEDEKSHTRGSPDSRPGQETARADLDSHDLNLTATSSTRRQLKRTRFYDEANTESNQGLEGNAAINPSLRQVPALNDVAEHQPMRNVLSSEKDNAMSPSRFQSPIAAFDNVGLSPSRSGDEEAGLHRIASPVKPGMKYTMYYQSQPQKSYFQSLRPYNGLLSHDNWFKVAARPFVLFAYPSILWSTVVYALSVGWLIVLSESVTTIYRSRTTYNFTALQTGLVYISPFVGGVLGTAVAGKVSDIIVRAMARRNGGIYEPEFRLVMAIPVALCTTIGLMGYGWAAQERDAWIVPTIFFGIISFGCCVGSTTAITFAVDSYRQYAGEALVTLNFSKNIFHGLVFSLFFNRWLDSDGPKTVFLALGGIQLGFLLFTIPMYMYGKRARMWTVRRNMMGKF